MNLNSLLVLSTLALAACSSSSPNEPDQLPDSESFGAFGARANARIAGSVGEDSLVASVTLTNRSTVPVNLTVNHQCPVAVRLYRYSGTEQAVYDEGPMGCSRIGRDVLLKVGGKAVLTRSVSLRELRAAGITAGRYRVEAIVIANGTQDRPGPFTVQAGEITLP